MSIERQLRRTNKVTGGATDPYWTSVSALVLTNSLGNTSQRTAVFDSAGTVTTTFMGTTTSTGGPGFSRLSPFPNKEGSYYSSGITGASGIKLGPSSATTSTYPSLNFSGDFTVECWVMVPTGTGVTSGYPSPIINGDNSGFFAYGPVANKWVAQSFGGAMSYAIASTVTAYDGIWRHLALVRSGTAAGNLKFYIDGVLIGSANGGTSVTNYSNSNLCCGNGASPGAADNQYRGYICNVRFSNIARYTSAFTSPTDYFTVDANTKFLFTCQGQYAWYDASNNKLPLTLQPPGGQVTQDSTIKKFSTLNSLKSVWYGGGGSGTAASVGVPSVSIFNTALTMPGDFTWEGWVYVSSATTQRTNSAMFISTNLSVFTSNASYPNVFSCSVNGVFIVSTINSKDSQWHHIAVVRNGLDSGNVKLYVDGISVGTPLTVTISIAFSAACFMGSTTTGNNTLIGNTDEFRITKGVARYISNFSVPSTTYPTS